MSSSTIKPFTMSAGSIILKLAYLLAAAATLYFLITRALPYLNFSHAEKKFGGQAILIYTHVVFGITATVLGPFQFIASIRRKNVKIHRFMGKTYLISTLIAAIVSWMIILPHTNEELPFKSGLFFLGVAWIVTGSMAYLAIRNGKITLHREWMVRSYVVTLAFVTYRLVSDLLGSYYTEGVGSMMAWMCWAVPLLITEIVLQAPKIYSKDDVKIF